MSLLLRRTTTASIVFAAAFALALPSYSQSFSVDTAVTQTVDQYSYAFTLNYDQIGTAQSLTDNVWDWTFYVDPSLPTPTDIMTPMGWKSTYDACSGQLDFYTEGPSGFGSGDFGGDVLLPGQSLAGFGLTTPAGPDSSIAYATDVQYNQDTTTATLPTTLPAAVPEVSAWQGLGIMLVLGGMLAFRRFQCQTRITNQQN